MVRMFAGALCAAVLLCSSAFAQVIYYEPVRYQHDSGVDKYCYGGSDPAIHAAAGGYSSCPHYGYATNLHRFDGGNSFGQPSPMYPRERVYSDCVGTQDASYFGYTAADARNEAYANAARYFRKADLLAAAVPTGGNTWVVPATPPPASVYLAPVYPHGTTVPSTTMPLGRGQILIIPKDLMNRPLKDFTEKKLPKVASAE